MRPYRAILAALLALAICCGCSRGEKNVHRQRVVTRIAVTGRSRGMELERVYASEAVLRQLLHRLNHIGRSTSMPRDTRLPDAFRLRFTLHYSDGSREDMIMIGTTCLWDASHGWRRTPPERLRGLFQYLLVTPSDAGQEQQTRHRGRFLEASNHRRKNPNFLKNSLDNLPTVRYNGEAVCEMLL